MRGPTWWRMISKTPIDWMWECTHRPVFAMTLGAMGYYWFYVRVNNVAEGRRFERFKQYFRRDVHYQENLDWDTKQTRDEMRSFVKQQIKEHGSFEAAIEAFEKKSGRKAPLFLLDDPVLDYTFRRVGVPVEGPAEPNFLWDGTPWTTRKPATTPDGKRPMPAYPTYYES